MSTRILRFGKQIFAGKTFIMASIIWRISLDLWLTCSIRHLRLCTLWTCCTSSCCCDCHSRHSSDPGHHFQLMILSSHLIHSRMVIRRVERLSKFLQNLLYKMVTQIAGNTRPSIVSLGWIYRKDGAVLWCDELDIRYGVICDETIDFVELEGGRLEFPQQNLLFSIWCFVVHYCDVWDWTPSNDIFISYLNLWQCIYKVPIFPAFRYFIFIGKLIGAGLLSSFWCGLQVFQMWSM